MLKLTTGAVTPQRTVLFKMPFFNLLTLVPSLVLFNKILINNFYLIWGEIYLMRETPSIPTNNSYKRLPATIILLGVIVCSVVAVTAYYLGLFSTAHSSVSVHSTGTIRWVPDHLYDLQFVTEDKGWVVGDYGTILTTHDGGKSWTRQETGTKALLRGVDFVDEKRGWAVGLRGTVLHTEDGGQSWVKQTIDTMRLRSLDPDIYLRDVDFIDTSRGWIIARTGSIFVTRDGGKNWREQVLEGKEAHLNRVRFFTQQIGWIVGEFGSLFVTRDGGRSWQARESGTSVTLMNIAFLNPQVGYVAGLSGTILRTRDGGESWKTISTGRKENFFDLCIDNGSGRILVLGTRFLHWFEGRNGDNLHWHEIILPAGVNLLETWFYSSQANPDAGVWVVGQKGIVLHCSSGGESCRTMLNWGNNVYLAKGGG